MALRYISLILAHLVFILLLNSPVIAGTQAHSCTIWFIENTSAGRQKRMRLFAVSTAKSPMDRLATAREIAIRALENSRFHFVDVFLFDTRTEPVRDDLSSYNAVAWIRYAPNPNVIPFMDEQWQGEYVVDNELHQEAYNWKRAKSQNSLLANLQYDYGSINCDLTVAKGGGPYVFDGAKTRIEPLDLAGCETFLSGDSKVNFESCTTDKPNISSFKFKTRYHKLSFWLGFVDAEYMSCSGMIFTIPGRKGAASANDISERYIDKFIGIKFSDIQLSDEKYSSYFWAREAGRSFAFWQKDYEDIGTLCENYYEQFGPRGKIARWVKTYK